MVNLNGNLTSKKTVISHKNRGFNYGDAVFETLKVVGNKILFLEDHYFRLMASLRILRMEIPMYFTMEFLEAEIKKTIEANQLQSQNVRAKIIVNRAEGGFYNPTSKTIDYLIEVTSTESSKYVVHKNKYEVDLYKDFLVAPNVLSTLKTNNKALHVVGSIYATENNLQNCLLLNTEKQIVEALNGNLFLYKDGKIKTPPLSSGCLKGIMRKNIIEIIKQLKAVEVEETPISPFQLQQADELFITNVIIGIQPITKYRKKEYKTAIAQQLLALLNKKIAI